MSLNIIFQWLHIKYLYKLKKKCLQNNHRDNCGFAAVLLAAALATGEWQDFGGGASLVGSRALKQLVSLRVHAPWGCQESPALLKTVECRGKERGCEQPQCLLGELPFFVECLSVAAPASQCLGCILGTHILVICIPELDRIQRGWSWMICLPLCLCQNSKRVDGLGCAKGNSGWRS